MKKPFYIPTIQIITLDSDLDVIATSEGIMLSSEGEAFNSKGRDNSPIWDD